MVKGTVQTGKTAARRGQAFKQRSGAATAQRVARAVPRCGAALDAAGSVHALPPGWGVQRTPGRMAFLSVSSG